MKAGFVHAKAHETVAMLRRRLKILSIKGKAIPVQAYYMPISSHEVETPIFLDSQQRKVVGLSILCIGYLYPSGNIPGTHLC
jgi:hypothetical protein